MIFLRDEETAKQWQGEEPEARDIVALQDAVEFAGAYFSPLVAE
jgi:hypothetical protein